MVAKNRRRRAFHKPVAPNFSGDGCQSSGKWDRADMPALRCYGRSIAKTKHFGMAGQSFSRSVAHSVELSLRSIKRQVDRPPITSSPQNSVWTQVHRNQQGLSPANEGHPTPQPFPAGLYLAE